MISNFENITEMATGEIPYTEGVQWVSVNHRR